MRPRPAARKIKKAANPEGNAAFAFLGSTLPNTSYRVAECQLSKNMLLLTGIVLIF